MVDNSKQYQERKAVDPLKGLFLLKSQLKTTIYQYTNIQNPLKYFSKRSWLTNPVYSVFIADWGGTTTLVFIIFPFVKKNFLVYFSFSFSQQQVLKNKKLLAAVMTSTCWIQKLIPIYFKTSIQKWKCSSIIAQPSLCIQLLKQHNLSFTIKKIFNIWVEFFPLKGSNNVN